MRIGVSFQDAAAENRSNGNLTQAQQEFNPVFNELQTSEGENEKSVMPVTVFKCGLCHGKNTSIHNVLK